METMEGCARKQACVKAPNYLVRGFVVKVRQKASKNPYGESCHILFLFFEGGGGDREHLAVYGARRLHLILRYAS